MNDLINGLKLNPPTNMNLVIETESKLGAKFPSDYKEFIVQYNGAVGTVGSVFIQLWPIDELVELNEGYAVKEFADGLVLFGSDGGGTAYAFDTRYEETSIVEVPFIDMDLDEITKCSDTFTGFLKYLASLTEGRVPLLDSLILFDFIPKFIITRGSTSVADTTRKRL